jgi:hypothetical protein
MSETHRHSGLSRTVEISLLMLAMFLLHLAVIVVGVANSEGRRRWCRASARDAEPWPTSPHHVKEELFDTTCKC